MNKGQISQGRRCRCPFLNVRKQSLKNLLIHMILEDILHVKHIKSLSYWNMKCLEYFLIYCMFCLNVDSRFIDGQILIINAYYIMIWTKHNKFYYILHEKSIRESQYCQYSNENFQHVPY